MKRDGCRKRRRGIARWICAVLLLIGAGLPATSIAAAFLRLETKIELPEVAGRIDHFAIDPARQRLFVSALGNDTLEIVDLKKRARIRQIPVSRPQGAAFLAKQNRIAAANSRDGAVEWFDADTFQKIRSITGLPDADNLRVDSATGALYAGYGEGALGVIEPGEGGLARRFPLGAHPESFQLDPASARVWINAPGRREIVTLDRRSGAILARWKMGPYHDNFPMAVDLERRQLIVGCRRPAQLLILDARNGRAIAHLPIGGDTDDLFWDARRGRIYVVCGSGEIDVCLRDGARSISLGERVTTAPGARTGWFSPELDRLYVAAPKRNGAVAAIWIFRPE